MESLNDLIDLHKSGTNQICEIWDHPEFQKGIEQTIKFLYYKNPHIPYGEHLSMFFDGFKKALEKYDKEKGQLKTLSCSWYRQAYSDQQRYKHPFFKTHEARIQHRKLHEILADEPDITDAELLEDPRLRLCSLKMLKNLRAIPQHLTCIHEDPFCCGDVKDDPDKHYKLYKSLEQLPEKFKKVIAQHHGLYDYDTMTFQSIADEDGKITQQAIHLRYKKGIILLTKILKEVINEEN